MQTPHVTCTSLTTAHPQEQEQHDFDPNAGTGAMLDAATIEFERERYEHGIDIGDSRYI